MTYKQNPILTTLVVLVLGIILGGLIGWCI